MAVERTGSRDGHGGAHASGRPTDEQPLPRYAIGIDIGGTFTDLVALDEQGGVRVHKILTTSDEPSRGALQGVGELSAREGLRIEQIDLVVHSTTLVTNALIQQRGARTGLLITRGFRDVLEMRDEHRYDVYDLFLKWPLPLVPRHRRLPITQRVTRDGLVLAEPQEEEVIAAVDALIEDGVEVVAISFLHSYRYPGHEAKVAEIIRRCRPALTVTVSSDVAPVIGEYERTSTTVADAYVRPLVLEYLTRMENGLRDMGFAGRFFLMLSQGGFGSVASARQQPIRLVESGPAAGALAAAQCGRVTASDPILSFDMGGTTAKVCVIAGGKPTMVSAIEVARTQRFKKGSGMPLLTPSVELLEIGAGGGSIARRDLLGLLKVGPESAGADPGPVCYGRGGSLPTVTDANLVLGYLDADYFLGGRMRLDLAGARAALAKLGDELGMSATEAAWGVHQVVNEHMAQAARTHVIERNWDPRSMTVVAFGGAGPAHAATIAGLIGAKRIVYPLGAGATSALGCLAAPPSFELVRSLPSELEHVDWAAVNALLAEMETRGNAALAEVGVPSEHVDLVREVEARIEGQVHELTIAVPAGPLGQGSRDPLRESFAQAYRRLYSRFDPEAVLEVITWKVTARGPARSARLQPAAPGTHDEAAALKGHRPAYFGDALGFVSVPVHDRYLLGPGSRVQGPSIIEEHEATVVMPPRTQAVVDEYWNLCLELLPSPDGRASA